MLRELAWLEFMLLTSMVFFWLGTHVKVNDDEVVQCGIKKPKHFSLPFHLTDVMG